MQRALAWFSIGLIGIGAAFFLILGFFEWSLGSLRQVFSFALGGVFLIVTVGGARSVSRNHWNPAAKELLIDQHGELVFQFGDGHAIHLNLASPTHTLRIIDYRTTPAGAVDGAPGILDPVRLRIPITGPACDAILETARSRGIGVSASSLPTASMSGRPLGKALVWDINPGKGIVGWFRRNN